MMRRAVWSAAYVIVSTGSSKLLRRSTVACRFPAGADFRNCPHTSRDSIGDGVAINAFPLAPAHDQPGIAQNSDVVRDSCQRDGSPRDHLATVHVAGCADGLENS